MLKTITYSWWRNGLLWLLGAVLTIWPFFGAQFRDAEGFVNNLFCFCLSVSFACYLLGWTVGGIWRRFGFWFALALVGQAVNLQMINAGPQLHYQHYKSLAELWSGPSAALLVYLAAQSICVAVGLYYHRWQLWHWLQTRLKLWQIASLGLIFYLSSTTVSENVSFYLYELLLASFVQTVNLGNILLMACAIPAEAFPRLQRWFQPVWGKSAQANAGEPGGLDSYVIVLALGATVLAAVLNVFSYQQHPHVPDEVTYLIQAQFFAHGAVKMPAPPVPEAFATYLMWVQGDYWYPVTPTGWSMILAIGAWLGAPWLVNPILAGVNILLAYRLIRELYTKALARIAVLFLALSPWYLFLGMSFMTHMASLCFALVAALGVAWARRKEQSGWAWMSGAALGMMALIRPLEALGMAGLLGLWAIGVGGKRLSWRGIAGLVLGSLLVGVIVPFYNAALTGNPLEFPIMAYTNKYFAPGANAYGFGPNRGMGWAIDPHPGHDPVDALINSNLNVSAMNVDLFGWSIGSLLLVGFALCCGRYQRSDYLMAAVILVIYTLHFFYYFSGGPDFGARYWFLMIVPLVVLAARGVEQIANQREAAAQQPGPNVRVYATVAALCLLTLINFIPWRAIDKYHHFRGMRPDIRLLAEQYHFGTSLVLVRGEQDPDYDSAMIYNPVDLTADGTAAGPIYAWDRDPQTHADLLRAYAGRPVWLVDSPSRTGHGFVVVAGPLATQTALAAGK